MQVRGSWWGGVQGTGEDERHIEDACQIWLWVRWTVCFTGGEFEGEDKGMRMRMRMQPIAYLQAV